MQIYTLLFCWATIGCTVGTESPCENEQPIRSDQLTPLILIPGFRSSNLVAQITKPNAACQNITGEIYVWPVNLNDRQALNCWSYNARLKFDAESGFTKDADGVRIYAAEFGRVESIEYITNRADIRIALFQNFIKRAEAFGYKRNLNLRAAPYDFRKAPSDSPQFMDNLKRLVEQMYSENNNRKVSILAQSMGNFYTLHFLQQQPKQWKKQYIHNYIFSAGPAGGMARITQALISGLSLSLIGPADPVTLPLVREVQRTWPFYYDTLPQRVLYNNNPIVVTASKSYSVNDYAQLYADIGFTEGPTIHNRFFASTNSSKAPGVETYCLHGTGYQTTNSVIFSGDLTELPSGQTTEDGDSTVLARIQDVCSLWKQQQSEAVHFGTHPNTTHDGMIKDDANIDYALKHVNCKPRHTGISGLFRHT